MALAQLMQPEQLSRRLGEPGLVVLDCRFALEEPARGRLHYHQGHIPGAGYLDLDQDLSGPDPHGHAGRHPLPEPATLLASLRAHGCRNESRIVLYDDGPGAFAARAWWLLAWLGKRDDVWLLDGGFSAWRAADLPLQQSLPQAPAGDFDGQADERLLIDADGLLGLLSSPELCLLDARGLPRFRGEVEPIDPVAGHIPGARCAPFTDNLDENGRFLPPDSLRARFEQLLHGRSPDGLVAYCGSGVTACHNLFALCLAGYPLARLYAPSWSGWISDARKPVARGD